MKTDNAKVTSLSVSVKVIRVGERQMTQAVFRQLPTIYEMDLFRLWKKVPTAVWGQVRYFWNDCCYKEARPLIEIPPTADDRHLGISKRRVRECGTHIHVIVQIGNELHRAGIWEYAPGDVELSQQGEKWKEFFDAMADTSQLFIAV